MTGNNHLQHVTVTHSPARIGVGKMRSSDQILKIVTSGGGVIIDASGRMTDQLIRIAAAAAATGAVVIIKNTKNMMSDSMVKIATAGRGSVIFDLSD